MSGIPNKMLPVAVEMLPEGYRRLEYLESTGTQWIDTGIKLSNESEVTCEFETPSTFNIQGEIFGSRTIGAGNSFLCWYYANADAQLRCDFESVTRYVTTSEPNKRYKITQSKTGVLYNDKLYPYYANGNAFETPTSCPLFAVWNNTQTTKGRSRIYSFSISRNNQLQLNFIPCLDNKGRPCMFDTVSCKPFYNVGDGEFLYRLPGDGELPAGYTRMEYIESTGTQYIDTGIKLSSESEVKCEHWQYYPSEINDYRYLYHTEKFFLLEGYVGSLTQSRLQTGARMNTQNIYPYWNAEEKVATILNIEGLSVNGVITNWKAEVEAFESTRNLWLFCASGDTRYVTKLSRIYSFSVSRAGVLQLNFIPCLDDKGVPCMFDTVTRTPFRNKGTGQFLYG